MARASDERERASLMIRSSRLLIAIFLQSKKPFTTNTLTVRVYTFTVKVDFLNIGAIKFV